MIKNRIENTIFLALASLFLIGCSTDSSSEKEENNFSKNISKVFEYEPGIGQYVNVLPKYESGDSKETMRKKVEEALKNNKEITLGAFGGYVVFGFDHMIENVSGQMDFRILGNAFLNVSEPGVVMVAYDKNKNGLPDEDEWYEIAGSEHNNPATIKNYEITYYKPSQELEEESGDVAEYIFWTDNQGNNGWKSKNSFHAQSYYPQWKEGSSITFKGTLLPNNGLNVNESGNNWQLKAFGWGYADNHPNTSDLSGIDIDWAIDKNGNKAMLPGIHFVKVYTGLNQETGWLGETSTEVTGAVDLHLDGKIIQTIK